MFKKQENELRYKKDIKHSKLARAAGIVLMCALIIATSVYGFLSVNVVSIFDGTDVNKHYTLKSDVRGILVEAGYNESYNVVSNAKDGNRINIEVRGTFPVYITYGDKTFTHITAQSSVKEIIADAGITLSDGDLISPDLEKIIDKESYIDIIPEEEEKTVVTASKQEKKEEVKKPASSSNKKPSSNTSNKKPSSNTSSKKPAASSKPSSSSSSSSSANSSSSSSSNASAVTGSLGNVTHPGTAKNPISELTPSSPIALDENGVPVNYKSSKRVQATAYSHTGNKCSTGVWPKPGYIAVDPKVIPYGTKMYIVSADGKYVYGYAIAADTGGFIKKRPTNVDLFMHTESACKKFGRRDVIIYFL